MFATRSARFFTASLFLALATAACTTNGSAPPSIQSGPDAELSFDGLHKVDNSKAELAWARPDLDLSGYSKILLGSVAFEYRTVTNKGRSTLDRSTAGPYIIDDKGRGKFEEVAAAAFSEELQKVQTFEFVSEPGPDVLMIRVALLDVVSYVPQDAVTRSQIYLQSIGAATLVLELRDSETNAILARSIDRRAVEQQGVVREVTSVTTISEVRRLMRLWGKRLHEGLDGWVPPEVPQ